MAGLSGHKAGLWRTKSAKYIGQKKFCPPVCPNERVRRNIFLLECRASLKWSHNISEQIRKNVTPLPVYVPMAFSHTVLQVKKQNMIQKQFCSSLKPVAWRHFQRASSLTMLRSPINHVLLCNSMSTMWCRTFRKSSSTAIKMSMMNSWG